MVKGYPAEAPAQRRGPQLASALGKVAGHDGRLGRKCGDANRGCELAKILPIGHIASEGTWGGTGREIVRFAQQERDMRIAALDGFKTLLHWRPPWLVMRR